MYGWYIRPSKPYEPNLKAIVHTPDKILLTRTEQSLSISSRVVEAI